MACASKLQVGGSLPNPNKLRTSDTPKSAFMSSASPNNFFDNNWESPSWSSESTRTYANTTRSHTRPNQMRMCDVSTLIMIPAPILSYARYVMSALDVKEEAKSTLLVDSAVLLNCTPLVPLRCVM